MDVHPPSSGWASVSFTFFFFSTTKAEALTRADVSVAAETEKSPEDDRGGPDGSSAVFLWRGRRSGGAVLQSSSHEDSQVRLHAAANRCLRIEDPKTKP